MAFLQIYLTIGLAVLAMMTLMWLLSLALKNASIIDIFWGAGFVVSAWIVFAFTPAGFAARKVVLTALVTIWGLRLALHILVRNWGQPEDFRYLAWRREAGGAWWWQSYFKVFLLQGVVMWLVAAPLVAAQVSPGPAHLTWLDYAAIPLWLTGFIFEAVGDWQLLRFKADPANRGRVLQTGVWRYTRHPNYFGDAAQWWAFYLFALAAGAWWTLFSPLLITTLLLRVSGVAMLEKTLKADKPGYRQYIASTSAFIPWPPRKTPR